MKNLKRNKGMRILAAAIAFAFVLVFVAAPYQLSANVCKGALEDCMIDVAIATLISLLGGPISAAVVALGYSTFCFNGYAFCMAYVVKQ
jgi:hypothetical protein